MMTLSNDSAGVTTSLDLDFRRAQLWSMIITMLSDVTS